MSDLTTPQAQSSRRGKAGSRAMIAIVLLTLPLAFAAAYATLAEPGPSEDISPLITVSVRLDRGVYHLDEPVTFALIVRNPNPYPVTVDFTSSCMAEFEVWSGAETRAYESMRHHACLDVMTQLRLEPGETREFSLSWDQSWDSGDPARAGQYRVVGFLRSIQDTARSYAAFTVLSSYAGVWPPDPTPSPSPSSGAGPTGPTGRATL